MLVEILISFILIYISISICICICIDLYDIKPFPYKKLNIFYMGYRLYRTSYLRRKNMNIFTHLFLIYKKPLVKFQTK